MATKYYTLVGTIDGHSEIIFGSYDRVDCVEELDAERHNLKRQGYKGLKITSEVLVQPEQEEALVNFGVAVTTAHTGTDAQRDKLIDDPRATVRRCIAQYGNDAHRERLLADADESVRVAVLLHANRALLEQILATSSCADTRKVAELRLAGRF